MKTCWPEFQVGRKEGKKKRLRGGEWKRNERQKRQKEMEGNKKE